MRISCLAGLVGLCLAAPLAAQTPTAAPTPPTARPLIQAPATVPPLTPENTWHLDLTSGGRVSIQLRPDVAPGHVERIKTLTRAGFYNGLTFHRVIEGFMAQGGDPQGTGQGGSEMPDLAAEFSTLPHFRGAVAMARAQDPNSANSQFYIMFVPRLSMDGQYTVFGRVVGGMPHVDAIARGEPPLQPTRIARASIGSDNVPPLTPEQLQAAAAAQARTQAPVPTTAPVLDSAPAQPRPQPQ